MTGKARGKEEDDDVPGSNNVASNASILTSFNNIFDIFRY